MFSAYTHIDAWTPVLYTPKMAQGYRSSADGGGIALDWLPFYPGMAVLAKRNHASFETQTHGQIPSPWPLQMWVIFWKINLAPLCYIFLIYIYIIYLYILDDINTHLNIFKNLINNLISNLMRNWDQKLYMSCEIYMYT